MPTTKSNGSDDPVSLSDNKPRWDLVGPTVNEDISRAIRRYGAEAVKAAVKAQTKAKKGRKPEKDWKELREVIEADARDWLNGGDPLKSRSNYSIARDFAHDNPGQSAASTHQRIERKLKKKPHDRRWFMLVTAQNLSRDGFPFADHIRALEALAALPPENCGREAWLAMLKMAQSDIADYEAKRGEYPEANLTMVEVESGAKNALLSLQQGKATGLTGLLGTLLPT